MFTDLFINMCILLSLIFGYLQLRWKLNIDQKRQFVTNLFDGIAAGSLGMILMSFSIHIGNGTMIDLRFVPIMLLMLFKNTHSALISTVLIIAGRFLFGVNPSAYVGGAFIAILVLGFMLIKRVVKSDVNVYKRSAYQLVVLNIIFSLSMLFVIEDKSILLTVIPCYGLVATVGGLFSVLIVDYLRKTNASLKTYKEAASVDFLTGLNNVRQFDQIWNRLVEQSRSKHEPLSLMSIDIDYFKRVNDTLGHPVGDQILIQLSKILQLTTRPNGIVSRNGGEEFSVILTRCSNQEAMKIAERVRKEVEEYPFRISDHQTRHITVSIGVATYPDTVKDVDHIIDVADQCLYAAKLAGRNCLRNHFDEK